MNLGIATFAVALWLTASVAIAAEESYNQFDPNAYQSFVANWQPTIPVTPPPQ